MAGITDRQDVRAHFDEIAREYDGWKEKNWYYYQNIKNLIRGVVPPGSRVLEIGCGTGELLASVKPSFGVGVDISPEMVALARDKFPGLTFHAGPIEEFKSEETFDYVVMVDVVDHVYDIMDVFQALYPLCHPRTKVVLTTINPWWDPILDLCEKLKLKMPEGPHNFVEKRSIQKMLELVNFKVNYSGYMMLLPKYIPGLSYLANVLGVRTWLLNKLSSTQYMIIQPGDPRQTDLGLGCSVVIPCYNEQDNIADAIRRVPDMGKRTEIIVVNDGSQDETAQRVKDLQEEYPHLKLIDYTPNRGKGHAVREGFAAASEEIVMILDADLTVPPEELPRFFAPLNQGLCQFVNGTRMVYPMEQQAMRFLNLLGNKAFSLMMRFITAQELTDTLCGTKAFYRKDLPHMKMGLDRWGDFDLLFSAARLGNKILEVPVHYKMRRAGVSKMNSLQHGLHLLRACWLGLKEVVFVPSANLRRVPVKTPPRREPVKPPEKTPEEVEADARAAAAAEALARRESALPTWEKPEDSPE